MGEILANLIGGAGIFFVGLRMITAGLKQMTSRRLRLLFARWTDTGLRAGLIGLVSGFVSQSMAAASFIVASLVATGMVSVRRALPVIFWANAGGGLIILLAVLDLKIFVLLLLGWRVSAWPLRNRRAITPSPAPSLASACYSTAWS